MQNAEKTIQATATLFSSYLPIVLYNLVRLVMDFTGAMSLDNFKELKSSTAVPKVNEGYTQSWYIY